jgi:hypothetical protein
LDEEFNNLDEKFTKEIEVRGMGGAGLENEKFNESNF